MSQLLTCARTHVPSDPSGLPIIVTIGVINSRDVATVTGNSAAPVLAKDRCAPTGSASGRDTEMMRALRELEDRSSGQMSPVRAHSNRHS